MWIDKRNTQGSLEILRDLSRICAQQGGSLAKALYGLVRESLYQELLDYDIQYVESHDVRDVIMARQILAFYSKATFLPLGLDTRSKAIERFYTSERMCAETNARFRFSRPLFERDVELILSQTTRKIAAILGEVPCLSTLNFAFGPGANTNVKSTQSCPRVKLSVPLTCSAELTQHVGTFLEEVPSWMSLHQVSGDENSCTVDVTVSHGKLVFVPKNAKTDRSIVVEPILNSFFQKGVGSYIRDRLQRFGVDLTDQTRNQDLAFRGSVDGAVATIDLSMASDCLSKNLVADLLPVPWWELLSTLRTGTVRIESANPISVEIQLEKFSSMGNGYTFELESMIFYALAVSTVQHLKLRTEEVSVYGDDIIVPTEAVALLTRILDVCGFSINPEKSFASGPFRESCGRDFFSGFDIRPFYQKELISDRSLYVMHNWFLRHGEFELAAAVHSYTYSHLRLYGPDGYGDGHLLGAFNLRRNRQVRQSQWGGGFFDTYTLKGKRFCEPLPGDAVLPVYSVYTRSGMHDSTDPNVVRGSRGYAKMSIYTLSEGIFLR